MKKVLALLAALFAVALLSACSMQNIGENGNGQVEQNGNKNGQGQVSDYVVSQDDMLQHEQLIGAITMSEVDDQEKAGLIQMREEEKLARDVYTTLYEQWGQKIFSNIAQSEQTHTDAVKSLLDRYGIEDPVDNDVVGEFTSTEMQDLYDNLVSQGSESLEEALYVGATVEDLDIKDLLELFEQTDNDDIKLVYENLERGSRNHMRAFVRSMERNSWSYSPQYIDQNMYQSILDSPQETGSGAGQGSGMRDGTGRGSGRGF